MQLRRRQRGIVAVVVAIGLVGLIAMMGLAIDTGHLGLNKSRLQSTVDAAALAAAKVLDDLGSEAQATAAARAVFDANAANHPELNAAMSGADITVTYSNTLSPFVPGSAPPNYVRVVANDFDMWTGFTSLVGMSDASTAASAVAGPSAPIESGEACNIVPVMVCGDTGAGPGGHWGYNSNNVTLLKDDPNSTLVGPGNFRLLSLGGTGANIVRQNLAGRDTGCINPDGTVTTQPGSQTGPTSQGLNTRFGQYQGGGMNATDYPPDLITTEPSPQLYSPDGTSVALLPMGGGNPMNPMGAGTPVTNINQVSYNYADYQADMSAGNYTNPSGKPLRRIVAVPVVDCAAGVNGRGTLPVLGFGCFFLLQQVTNPPGGANDSHIFAQYTGEQCAAGGTPGPNPGPIGGPGIYEIVLHNDPGSPDS